MLTTTSLDRILRLYWIAAGGIIIYVILDAVAQSLPPHYSPISQAESLLAIGPYGYIMTVNFLNRGLFSLAFLLAFVGTLNIAEVSFERFSVGIYLLGTWAIAAFLLALFPAVQSWVGLVHIIIAFVAFVAAGLGTLQISRNLGQNKELQNMGGVALPLSVAVMIFLIVDVSLPFVSPHLNSRFGGLTERLFLGSVVLWILVGSVYMITHLRSMVTGVTKESLV